jgi:periplasmic protein TonB
MMRSTAFLASGVIHLGLLILGLFLVQYLPESPKKITMVPIELKINPPAPKIIPPRYPKPLRLLPKQQKIVKAVRAIAQAKPQIQPQPQKPVVKPVTKQQVKAVEPVTSIKTQRQPAKIQTRPVRQLPTLPQLSSAELRAKQLAAIQAKLAARNSTNVQQLEGQQRSRLPVGTVSTGSSVVGALGARSVLSKPAPLYPETALRAERSGTVRIRLFVSALGQVSRALVIGSSGSGTLDRAALSAVYLWRFSPIDAAGAEQYGDVNIHFRL